MRRKRDEIGQQRRHKEEGDEAFTNLMKKCVDELPGKGTFIAPDAPCAVLAAGLGLGLDGCIGSDLGGIAEVAEVVLLC